MQSVDVSHFSVEGKALRMPKIQQPALVTFYSKKIINQDPRLMKMLQQLAASRTDVKWLVCDMDSNSNIFSMSKSKHSLFESVHIFLVCKWLCKSNEKAYIGSQRAFEFYQ